MATFADRLQEELDYRGLSRKELAQYANIKSRALAMYLGTQQSMPPADVAVKLAKVLHVSVEYLVTGKNSENHTHTNRFRFVEHDLESLPQSVVDSVTTMIHTLAENENRRTNE